jgi:hypothetical protein
MATTVAEIRPIAQDGGISAKLQGLAVSDEQAEPAAPLAGGMSTKGLHPFLLQPGVVPSREAFKASPHYPLVITNSPFAKKQVRGAAPAGCRRGAAGLRRSPPPRRGARARAHAAARLGRRALPTQSEGAPGALALEGSRKRGWGLANRRCASSGGACRARPSRPHGHEPPRDCQRGGGGAPAARARAAPLLAPWPLHRRLGLQGHSLHHPLPF